MEDEPSTIFGSDCTEVSKQAFAVVLGQCSQTVRERIRASTSWRTVNDNSDLMGLLRLVRESLYTGATTRHPIHSLQEAEEALMSFRQGDNMSNHVYYEKFKGVRAPRWSAGADQFKDPTLP